MVSLQQCMADIYLLSHAWKTVQIIIFKKSLYYRCEFTRLLAFSHTRLLAFSHVLKSVEVRYLLHCRALALGELQGVWFVCLRQVQ